MKWRLIGGAVIVLIIAIAALNPWTGFLKDRLAKSEAKGETSADAVVALTEQGAGQAQIVSYATAGAATTSKAERVAYVVQREAASAPGTEARLDPAFADSLRRADVVLCGLREGVCRDGADSGRASDDHPR